MRSGAIGLPITERHDRDAVVGNCVDLVRQFAVEVRDDARLFVGRAGQHNDVGCERTTACVDPPAGAGSHQALCAVPHRIVEPSDLRQPLDQDAKSLTEGPHALRSRRRLAAGLGVAPALSGRAEEAANQAAGLALHHGQARECRGDTESAGSPPWMPVTTRIGEDVGGLLARAARDELGDRFIRGDARGDASATARSRAATCRGSTGVGW